MKQIISKKLKEISNKKLPTVVFVFDFDDTILQKRQKVHFGQDYYTNQKYYSQNWKDFHRPASKFKDFIKISKQFDVFILTARDNDDQMRKTIHKLCLMIGAEIQLNRIIMVGKQKYRKQMPKKDYTFEQIYKGKNPNQQIETKLAQLKAQYLKSMINLGAESIIFYDDLDTNIEHAQKVNGVVAIKS